jgi:hypothetical protein
MYIWNKLKLPPFIEEPDASFWSSFEGAVEEASATQTKT